MLRYILVVIVTPTYKIVKINFSSKDISKKWEISLPNIIKYPKEGFFITLLLKTKEKSPLALKITEETPLLIYYPNENNWKKMSFNSYLYELKIIK